jgi:SAM-dependent methyltransferase
VLRGERTIPFTVGNLYERPLPFKDRQFDIVVLHDVFEHLEEKDRILAALRTYMKPDGVLLITFPPYFSAYGAHQQHCITPWARLPFIHLLPFVVSRALPSLKGEYPSVIEEVQKLHRQKMGMRSFERIAADGGLRVHRKRAYFISPNHIRFGLRPVPAGPIASVPVIGEVLCTGVAYLLKLEH